MLSLKQHKRADMLLRQDVILVNSNAQNLSVWRRNLVQMTHVLVDQAKSTNNVTVKWKHDVGFYNMEC
jgi:hypothetical protein